MFLKNVIKYHVQLYTETKKYISLVRAILIFDHN